ncbi:PE family protein [Rhodococcus sp. NPDC003318]|uniref:PE family protein n=1 Tax=Rhodococcus sp. NPDC003318 TaxID=3364503 RepID=UPI0036AD99F7
MPGHVFVSPDALNAAATQLEALAGRLQATVGANGPALHMAPAGTEEVSVQAAAYFNGVADSFLSAAAAGVAELVDAAAVLRAQAAEYAALDDGFGAALGAGM